MNNAFPTNWGQLFVLATKMYNGLVAFAAAIPVTMVTAAQLLASRTAFKNAGDTFNAARTTLNTAHRDAKPAQDALYEWLLTARAVIARRIGERWSPQWAAAGFVAPSTAVPGTIDGQIALGQSLVTYYTDNPDFEVADMDVTEAKASDLTAAAVAGRTAITTAEEEMAAARDARRPAKADLLKLMRTVVANLDKKLAPDDPRWLAFGLQLPSTQTTPAAPTGLRATQTGSDILLECDATPYATRYRFRRKIVGVDDKYKLVASSLTPMAMLEGVAAGLTMEIIAQAVNGSSQSVASDPIVVETTPMAAAKSDSSSDELAPLAAIGTNGNGSGGVGNGATLAPSRS